MKIRTFITTGDELNLKNLCKKFNCNLQIGGPPNEYDYTMNGFERNEICHSGSKSCGRTDWMVVYLNVNSIGQALGIRAHFLHSVK